jgi:DNA invertase Pin-like site-specific DNA recombinase
MSRDDKVISSNDGEEAVVIGDETMITDPVIGDGLRWQIRDQADAMAPAVWDKRTFARNRAVGGSRDGRRGGGSPRAGKVDRTAARTPSPGDQSDAITALGYIRVSTDEQSASGAGLTAQRAAIEAEAARRGWQLLDVVEDAGFSGRNLRRPGIRAALDALRSGGAAALIVAKVDRLSRSMVDFTALMDRSAREGWALVALDLGVDTSTPSGEAMVNVMATFSQFERRLIGQRTKEALAIKRAQGVRLGRPPVLPDVVVQRMCRERAAGATLQAIADGLDQDGIPTAQGGRCWHAATVRDVIRASERRMSAGASGKSQQVRMLHRGG